MARVRSSGFTIPVVAAALGAVVPALVSITGPAAGRQQPRAVQQSAVPTPGPLDDVTFDWNNPIPSGTVEPDVQSAAKAAAFQPAVPSMATLAAPEYIVGDEEDVTARPVVLLYKDPALGEFWVSEGPTYMSQSALEDLVATCDPTQGCEGIWSLVQLADGKKGVVVQGPQTNGVMVLEGDVLVNVLGPNTSLSAAAALAVAGTLP